MCPVLWLPGLGGFLKMLLSLGAELGFDTHCQVPQVRCLYLADCPHPLCPSVAHERISFRISLTETCRGGS